jgi:transcription factor SPN1
MKHIETHHLRESSIGRIVMFYSKCEKITLPVKKIATRLVRTWMRPILKRSANYRDGTRREVRYEGARADRYQDDEPVRNADEDDSKRARIPQKIAPAFNVVPISNLSGMGGEKRPDKFKKLRATLKSGKRR